MIARPVQILAAWLCLATCSFGSMAPGKGLLLCLGMDGHIDVNSVEDGCNTCVEPSSEGRSDPCSDEAGIDGDESCCPCVDIPVVSAGSDVRQPTSRPVVDAPSLIAVAWPSVGGAFETRMPPGRFAGRSPRGPSGTPLAHLRSVVLIV